MKGCRQSLFHQSFSLNRCLNIKLWKWMKIRNQRIQTVKILEMKIVVLLVPDNRIGRHRATPSAVLELPASPSPGSLLERMRLSAHPRSFESESAFYQRVWVIGVHVKVWEALVYIIPILWSERIPSKHIFMCLQRKEALLSNEPCYSTRTFLCSEGQKKCILMLSPCTARHTPSVYGSCAHRCPWCPPQKLKDTLPNILGVTQ